MRYNTPAVGNKLPAVGRALTGTEVARSADAVTAVESLMHDLRVPVGIADLKVAGDQLRPLAEDGLLAGAVKTNPRPVREEDALAILEEASKG